MKNEPAGSNLCVIIAAKNKRQFTHRLGAPLAREVLVSLRRGEVSAIAAAGALACGQQTWKPGSSDGDHARDLSPIVEHNWIQLACAKKTVTLAPTDASS